jgi:hypothetical protein
MFFPVFLFLVGAFFLLSNLGYLPPETWGIFWPLLLIAIAVSMMARRKDRGSWCCWPWEEDKKKKK